MKYFDRPAGNVILKIVGIKEKESAEDVSQLLYLELEKSSNKIVLGVFLTNSKKFKSILSFPSHTTSMTMTQYFRVNQKSNIISFLLDSKTFVVLFTISTKPGSEWFSNVANQCCQISISSSSKSDNESETANPVSIEGFVTEVINNHEHKELTGTQLQPSDIQSKTNVHALSVVATSNRQIHLYTSDFQGGQGRPASKPLGKYFINIQKLTENLPPSKASALNIDNLKLNNMFLIPELNNRLIMVYVAINKDKKSSTDGSQEFPRIDILFIFADIHPENKQIEDIYKDIKHHGAPNTQSDESTTQSDSQTPANQQSKNLSTQPHEFTEASKMEKTFVIHRFSVQRRSFDDRDLLGDDWAKTKVLIPEVRLKDDKLHMLLSSDTLKIQELVVFDSNNQMTCLNIKDNIGQKVASVDHLLMWSNKQESSQQTLQILSQSISENQRAIRDQTLEIKLAPPSKG